MKTFSYELVNVFTRNGKGGNPLAVFDEPAHLETPQMQELARRIGLSETVFRVEVKDGADYAIRIFTPEKELPFAGHPTIGSLFTLLRAGHLKKKKTYIQQVHDRYIPLKLSDDGFISMDQGEPKFGESIGGGMSASLLTLKESDIAGPATAVSTGLPFIIIPLSSFTALKKAKVNIGVNREAAKATGAEGVLPFAVYKGEIRCRMLGPLLGIPEDPATGSAVGPLACYVVENRLLEAKARGALEVDILQGIGKGGPSLLRAIVRGGVDKGMRVEVGGYCRYVGKRSIKVRD